MRKKYLVAPLLICLVVLGNLKTMSVGFDTVFAMTPESVDSSSSDVKLTQSDLASELNLSTSQEMDSIKESTGSPNMESSIEEVEQGEPSKEVPVVVDSNSLQPADSRGAEKNDNDIMTKQDFGNQQWLIDVIETQTGKKLGTGNADPVRRIDLQKVTNIDVKFDDDSYLGSKLPEGIGLLTNVNFLRLAGENLSGTIPSTIGDMVALNRIIIGTTDDPDNPGNIKIDETNLEGAIPSTISNLSNLTVFRISAAGKPFGDRLKAFTSLPDTFGNLTQLKELGISGTNIENWPSSISNLVNLETLILTNNLLQSVPIPDMSKLTKLVDYQLSNTYLKTNFPAYKGFTGELPAYILANNPALKIFDLGANSLIGEIPKIIGNAKNLEKYVTDLNLLTGSIPNEVSGATKLQIFRSYGNEHTGNLPEGLADLPDLNELNFDYNDEMTGKISEKILNKLAKMDIVRLKRNEMTIDIPNEKDYAADSLGMTFIQSSNNPLKLSDFSIGVLKPEEKEKLYFFNEKPNDGASFKVSYNATYTGAHVIEQLQSVHTYEILDDQNNVLYNGVADDSVSIPMPRETTKYRVIMDNTHEILDGRTTYTTADVTLEKTIKLSVDNLTGTAGDKHLTLLSRLTSEDSNTDLNDAAVTINYPKDKLTLGKMHIMQNNQEITGNAKVDLSTNNVVKITGIQAKNIKEAPVTIQFEDTEALASLTTTNFDATITSGLMTANTTYQIKTDDSILQLLWVPDLFNFGSYNLDHLATNKFNTTTQMPAYVVVNNFRSKDVVDNWRVELTASDLNEQVSKDKITDLNYALGENKLKKYDSDDNSVPPSTTNIVEAPSSWQDMVNVTAQATVENKVNNPNSTIISAKDGVENGKYAIEINDVTLTILKLSQVTGNDYAGTLTWTLVDAL